MRVSTLQLHSRCFRAMGSPCELRFYARSSDLAEAAHAAAVAVIAQLEDRYSRYRPSSLTSRINAAAGTGDWLTVDAETAGLLDYAQQVWQQSEGLFDITSGILRQAWDFRVPRLPTQADIDALLPKVGWETVEWTAPRIRLPKVGMELDFGGYVKEYAADAAARALREQGIEHGFVELGGDIAVIGPHPDGAPWRIGVRHPRQPDTALAMLELHEGALASSGDYERSITVDGVRYGHILNPKTGWPVQSLAAVSVVAPQCLLAGTATTVALLKQGAAKDWLQMLELPYLAVTAEAEVFGTLKAAMVC